MSDIGGFDADADATIERIQQQIVEAQQRAEAATAMRQQVEAVRGVGYSPRREVTVTVDASGRLLSVDLAESALQFNARALGKLISDVALDAQRKAAAKAAELAAEVFGEDSAVVSHLRGELAEGDKGPRSSGIHY